jgi:hypothetical protein
MLLLAGLAVGGCTMRDQLTRQGTDYNQLSANVHDRVLLTNILRARDNAPIHFTVVSQIRGAASVRGSASLSAPFGRYLSTANIFGLAAETAATPTLDVNTLETQEFTQGLLDPIDPLTFKLFWDRGFQPQLLLRLMVNEVISPLGNTAQRSEPKADDPCPISSRTQRQSLATPPRRVPSRSGEHSQALPSVPAVTRNQEEIDDWIRRWTVCRDRLTLNSYTQYAPIGPSLSTEQAADARLLAGLAAPGALLRLRPDPEKPGRYRLYRESREVAFCYRTNLGLDLAFFVHRASSPSVPASAKPPTQHDACNKGTIILGSASRLDDIGDPDVTIRLRSVDQIIYYLGHLPTTSTIDLTTDHYACRPGASQEPRFPRAFLFQVRDSDTGPVAVTYEGRRYSIPPYVSGKFADRLKCEGGEVGDRSLQVFSLLTHLINLKRKAADLPTTRAVQVIN